MKTRIITTAIGSILLSLGIAILIYFNRGMAAFDMFTLSFAYLFNVSYTFALRVIQFIFLLMMLVMKKPFKYTWPDIFMPLISMAIISTLINEFSEIVNATNEDSILLLIFGIFCYTYGITLLVRGNIMLAPNDKFIIGITNITKHTYAFYKVISDVLMLLVSIILIYINDFDIQITILTVLLTFFTGVLVGIFTKFNRQILRF